MGPENSLIAKVRQAMTELEDVKLFLVGGSVRDILLGRTLSDYDFLIEGELFVFANLLGERLKCPVSFNRKLLTASFATEWGSVDFSQARQETYQNPGELPKVCPASWQDDLKRRDFTINTLLLPLTPNGWGEIQDLLGGKQDLQAGLIRILHSNSFRDDPTRILRAIRLKNRLGFTWDSETLATLQMCWTYLKLVSPIRRFKEWDLICKEQEPTKILQEIYALGGWETYFGTVPYNSEVIASLSAISQDASQLKLRAWFLGLLILSSIDHSSYRYLAYSWSLPAAVYRSIEETFTILEAIQQGLYKKKRMIYRELRKLPQESIFFVYQKQVRIIMTWEDFVRELQNSHMPLRGKDLLKLGMEPGVELGRVLNLLEDSYWQEEFTTRQEGLKLAHNFYLGGQ